MEEINEVHSVYFGWKEGPVLRLHEKDGSLHTFKLRYTQLIPIMQSLTELIWQKCDLKERP